MKTKTQQRLRPALAGFTLIAILCSALVAQAQDLIVNSFDNDGGGTLGLGWANFRTYAHSVTYSFDPAQDSGGNPSSGAMYLTVGWPSKSEPTWNQDWNDIQLAFSTPPFNPSDYIDFDVDIKVDVAHSALSFDGYSYGALELIINNPWTGIVGWAPIAVTGDWQHFHGSFSGISSLGNSEAVIGFISTGGGSPTNAVSYWIDNIVFTAPPTVFTNQPVMHLAKAPPAGLTCMATKPSGTWQRQMVSTVNGRYSWNTASASANTTTYSMNIASFPNGSHPQFESQMFLIPQDGLVSGASIDWYSTNVVDFFVGVNPDGSGGGTFQHKVNSPSSGNYSVIVTQPCPSGPVGTWSLSFNNNTNVTITAPDHSSTNFTISASDAALFKDPLFVYLGTLPNGDSNIGQSSTFSRFQVSGAAGSINDTFGTLDSATWALYAEDPAGVFITAPDTKFWVTWPLPDGGFTNLYASDKLTKRPGSAQSVSLPAAGTGWLKVSDSQRLAVIKQSTLTSSFGYAPTNCFFGLFHQ